MSVDRSRLPDIGTDRSFNLPRPVKSRLAGGPDLWTVEHRGVPVVAALLLIPAGSAVDPADRPGVAALTADLLDEGAGDLDSLALHDALGRIGAHLDTECTCDATVLDVLSLARHAERALGLLADVAFRPRCADEDFDRLRTLRRNRLLQMRDMPGAQADRAFLETLYRDHPYGHLPIGTEAALDLLTPADVRDFHARWFDPVQATLVIAGDIAHDDARRLAERTFVAPGRGSRQPAPAGVPGPTASGPVGELLLVHRPNAQQSELRIGRIGLARDTSHYHSTVVANAVLGGQFTSRINLNLREHKGYTYGARSYFDFRRAPGPFVVQASVQTDATAASIREVFGELVGLRGNRPVTTRELDLARWGLTRGYARNFETAEQIARAMAQLELYGLPDDYFDTFVDHVRSVDAEAVTSVAQRHFDPRDMFTVVVGDRTRVERDLDEIDFARRTVVDTLA